MRPHVRLVPLSAILLLTACGGSGGGGGGGGVPLVPSGLFVPAAEPASWTGIDVRGMFARDQDQDGKLDLLAIDLPGDALFARRGLGDGHFEPAVGLGAFSNPNTMLLADLDDDGIPEALALDFANTQVSVAAGNPDGTFDPPVNYAVSGGSESFAVGDVNGDLDPDVVVGSQTGVTLWLGGPGTTLVAGTAPAAGDEYFVAFADVDEDGKLDLLSGANGFLRYRLGNGDGTFGAVVDFPFPEFIAQGPLVLGDVNEDGHVDVVSCRGIIDEVGVSLGDGDGGFTAAPHVTVGDTIQFAFYCTLAHLNGDAHLDLLVAREDAGEVHVLHGVGDGTFTPAQVLSVSPQIRALLVADLNGDGAEDLLVACISGGGTTYAFLGTSL